MIIDQKNSFLHFTSSPKNNPTCLYKHKRYRLAEEVLVNERFQYLR